METSAEMAPDPLGRATPTSSRCSSWTSPNGVVYQTARMDLLTLAERGLLRHHRVGKRFVFRPVEDIQQRVSGTSDEYHPALMRSR
jgi:predicted transcriptional regulator